VQVLELIPACQTLGVLQAFGKNIRQLQNLVFHLAKWLILNGFFEKPELAWAFYGHRLNLYRETIPHKGYFQLLEIGEEKPGGYFVFTSNVDGQFQKAGYNDEYIEECHGSIHHFQCIEPCCNNIWDANEEEVIIDMGSFQAQEPFPKCANCGSIARPNILMFGDWHWIHQRSF